MTTWVDTRTPTKRKWIAIAFVFFIGVGIAAAPVYFGLSQLHGWSLWAVAMGVVITLLATSILQTHVALACLVLASFAFCVNVNNGHVLAWTLAWLATAIGALMSHSFLVDMSWLYHWSKDHDSSADNQENDG